MCQAEFDIIFAGGGAAACVAAGRLAAADPSLKILILEQGSHTYGLLQHIQPARYWSHLAPTSKTVSFHVAAPSKELAGRSLIVPSGRCVGGGSSVNFMMYTRAAASDYDDWETVYGNAGWGSKDLIPLLKKTETYQVAPGETTHGYSGPLKVSMGGAFTNVGKEFLDLAAKYDKGRGSLDDVNGLFKCDAYGAWPKWIDAETGKRSDVPHHFIYNKNHAKNLEVRVECKVKRIIIENGHAVGVEYVKDRMLNPNSESVVYTAHASRLTVVSAGAFGSPTILERSGIGAKSVLERHGVKQVVDLPGVGEHYQDHPNCFSRYLAADEADSLDPIFRNDEIETQEYVTEWTKTGRGLMAHNGFDAGIKLRPNENDLKELGPEFQTRWEKYFASAPDKPVVWIGPVAASFIKDHSSVPVRKYFGVCYFTEYPVSMGRVHIQSGEDPHAAPDFEPGYLREAADVAVLRWGYKRSRELARRMGLYRGEFLPGHPTFGKDSDASCKETAPADVTAPDIVYTAKDDKAIDAYHSSFVQTSWHSIGTCAMKPRDQGGVVDERLNVYDIKRLKVADASVAPGNVGANTYSTALVIGEKAAIIIGEELGITGV